jgi:hypothetical protein
MVIDEVAPTVLVPGIPAWPLQFATVSRGELDGVSDSIWSPLRENCMAL